MIVVMPDRGMKKEHILLEIKRTAGENGGVPLGMDRFREATDIRKEDWLGIYWAKWSDAQVEAGLEPNQFGAPAFDEEWMLSRIAEYIRELGRYPTPAEFRLKKRNAPKFPNAVTIRRRLGNKPEVVKRVSEHCRSREGWQDVLDICLTVQASIATNDPLDVNTDDGAVAIGHVYLLKHGKEYKIGRSTDASRRHRQISVQMPHRTEEIHVIETDDPVGIEAYWHNRFKDKRLEGEWFKLSAGDVKAFKRRRFM